MEAMIANNDVVTFRVPSSMTGLINTIRTLLAENGLTNAENEGVGNISQADKERLMRLIEADERGELKYSTLDEVRRRFGEHMAQK